MARNKNGTNLSQEELDRAIWFDIEKRIDDAEPALTGFLVGEDFTVVVHDPTLQIGAEYSDLGHQPAAEFYRDMVERCRVEKRLLISYTKADFDFVISSNPELEEAMLEVYQKTKFTSYFRHKRPDLFAEMQTRLKTRHMNRRYRYQTKIKKSGEFEVGLKDMLKLEAVGYPGRKQVGIGGSGKAIGMVRKRFDKLGNNVEALAKSEKKAWSRMLTYLKHDVYGLRHLTYWVNES